MGLEGRLSIELLLNSDGVSETSITSDRPVHAASVLRGRSRAEVQKTLPLLFSVCSTAQACASVRALEQARGVDVDDALERRRDALVNLETLREHLWRVLLDWPLFVDEPPARAAMAEVASLQREITAALSGSGDLFTFGGTGHEAETAVAQERLQTLIADEVLGISLSDWFEIVDLVQLRRWIDDQDSTATRFLHRVTSMDWERAGACDMAPLPGLTDVDVAHAMRDRATIERPQWQGECRETSSLTRNDSELLRQLRARHGNGLLTRLVARLHEIVRFALALLPETRTASVAPVTEDGIGIGQTSAARGQLFHRVEIDDEDRVTDYRILAPTEWNFHPDGVVRRTLSALKGGAEQIEQQARLLVTAIDPCVGYDLRLSGAR